MKIRYNRNNGYPMSHIRCHELDLDKALYIYAKEHGCSYDEALIFAKTGEKMGRLEK